MLSHKKKNSFQVNARLPGLDVLRAFAALWVFVFHYMELAPKELKPGIDSYYIIIGWNGVDLFFVLSGFLIGGILCRGNEHVGSFMIRRFFRIYPAYLLMVFLGIAIVKPHLANNGWLVASHLFMFNNLIPGYGGAVNGVLWTLGAEFQFYMISALILVLPRGRNFWFSLVALMVVGSLLYRWAVFGAVEPSDRFFYTTQLPGMLGLFGMGFLAVQMKNLVGECITKFFPVFFAMSIVLLFLFFEWLRPHVVDYWDNPESVVFGRFFSGVVFAFLVLVLACAPGYLNNFFRKSGLVFIGEISYGIYLTHLFFYELLRPHEGFFERFNWSFYALVLLIFTLISSCLIYFLVERPFIRLGAMLASGAWKQKAVRRSL